jgi:hypothetical protein
MWSSKLQVSPALSSTEAEYVALASAAREVLWCRNFLQELGLGQNDSTAILQDNKSCITIAESYRQHPGVKHIDIRHHFIRDRIKQNQIKLEKMGDIFTKQLPFPVFKKHRDRLCMNFR